MLCALASCYTTTFRALAEYSKLEYTDLEVEVQGTIRKEETGYVFEKIHLHPKLTIPREEDQPRATKLLEKAKGLCLVSRAISVTQLLDPEVRVLSPHLEFTLALPAG